MNLKFWDKTETLLLADGTPADYNGVVTRWPFAAHVPVVLEMNGPLVAAIDSLPVLESVYKIDVNLSDEDKLAAIKAAREAAQNPPTSGDPTPEERLAAALEFQNMLALASMNAEPEEGGVPA